MAVTFDSVTLTNPEPYEFDWDVRTNETVLLSGKRKIQSTSEIGLHIGFVCHTDTLSDVTNLRAKIGTKASLVTGSDTYTNCYISLFKQTELLPGVYEYTVEFRRETA